jgi:16S rRNA (cytosine967-C5)-methyltransferase
MTSARAVALELLTRIENTGAYANLVIGPALTRSELSDQDRRFVTELVYGTTRMRRACDVMIDRFVTQAPEAGARTLLRLGVYQLCFADVAPHAAVSETVQLAPKRLRGFINAVLRKVSNAQPLWPSIAAELSYPDWIVERLIADLGEVDAVQAMRTMNQAAAATVRADGYTQDRSSQWVALAVDAVAGETVVDLCAAPGGKATAMASSGARVIAADLRAPRAALIQRNARDLKLQIPVVVGDALHPPLRPGTADAVLLDAPCSGLGALRRRPDARWRITPQDVEELVVLQAEMLTAAARLVRPGGRLIYSVCTLTAAESIDHQIPAGFEVDSREPEGAWRRYEHGWRVLPQDAGTDGMVLIRYRRRDD